MRWNDRVRDLFVVEDETGLVGIRRPPYLWVCRKEVVELDGCHRVRMARLMIQLSFGQGGVSAQKHTSFSTGWNSAVWQGSVWLVSRVAYFKHHRATFA